MIMSALRAQFDEWMLRHDVAESPATPAATVVPLRDGPGGPEVLMVKRNSKGSFASAWVFPGGKVDPEDHADPGDPSDVLSASRRAAAREAQEEADLVVDEAALVPMSHWMPPSVVPRRFATWFFLAHAPGGSDGDVTIDGGEIVDHVWVSPADALKRQRVGEVELLPPTWVTLNDLVRYDTVAAAIDAAAAAPPTFFVTQMLRDTEHPTVAWPGDELWGDGDAAAGARHRLTMNPDGWSYEKL